MASLSIAVVDAFPLDAVERKLMFGARPGVTLTVVTWFIADLEHNLHSEAIDILSKGR